MSFHIDFNPRYPFLIERAEPISSVDIADYVRQLTDNQAMKQIENVAIEEGMATYWILRLQQLRDETTKINTNLTCYSTRLWNLKTLLENRMGFQVPRFEQDIRDELMVQYVFRS